MMIESPIPALFGLKKSINFNCRILNHPTSRLTGYRGISMRFSGKSRQIRANRTKDSYSVRVGRLS